MRVKTMGISQLVRKFLKVIKVFFVFENQSIQTDVVNTNRWGHFYCEDSMNIEIGTKFCILKKSDS